MESPPPITRARRSRVVYGTLVAATVLLGLGSRRYADACPDAVRLYVGDVLWAAMVYFAAATVWPAATVRRLVIATAVFSLVIEASQLYHAPWIDAVRATRPGGLVLGFGFRLSDIVCYAIGVGLAALMDAWSLRRGRREDIVS